MPLILPGNVATALGGDYEVANSLRFNDDDSAQLAITPSSDGSAEKWTLSFWMKMGGLTTDQRTVRAYAVSSSGSRSAIYFDASDQFSVGFNPSGSSWTTCTLQDDSTNMRFRDPGAWIHFVVACDTTQGTAANRLKGYVNGVQKTFDAYPAEDMDTMYNKSGRSQYIGWRGYTTGYLDDYLAEVYWIDGTQYAASDFGEYDDDSPRIWKPKDSSGLTFGTNGYYLDFEDSSALGNDAAGSNNLTVTNLAAVDQCVDTPTNSFAVLNPLSNYYYSSAFSEGNTKLTSHASNYGWSTSTFAVSKGKWYIEVKDVSGASHTLGIVDRAPTANQQDLSAQSFSSQYGVNGKAYINGSEDSSYDTFANDDILGIALDLDNNRLYYSKNGTWQGSSDPANGTNPLTITTASSTQNGVYFIAVGDSGTSGNPVSDVNFGNPPFTISSSNADGNGYGSFEYAPPSGFLALCTKNLAEEG